MKLLMLLTVFIALLHNVKGQSGMSTSGILTRIGFDQLNDVAEEGQANKFVRIRLLTGPVSDNITGSVVPLTVEQLESYIFNTFRIIPPELWQYIDEIKDPAQYEEGVNGTKDFNNSVINFTIPAGDDKYDIPTSDVIIDDSINEIPEDFILVLDSIEPAETVELDSLYEGILVFTISDNDDGRKSSVREISIQLPITIGLGSALIVVFVMACVIIILILVCKRNKGNTYPEDYDDTVHVDSSIEMSEYPVTSKKNIAYGARQQPAVTSTNTAEMYEEVEQLTAPAVMVTRNLGFEKKDEEATPAKSEIDMDYI